MSSKTKIFVLHMKEIIYTVFIALLILLLIILFFFMFASKPEHQSAQETSYIPGVYSSEITLNANQLSVEVSVSNQHIEAIRINNLDDSVTAMYPLLQPTIEYLSDQICQSQSLDNIVLSSDSPYTSRLLLNAIEDALSQAVK